MVVEIRPEDYTELMKHEEVTVPADSPLALMAFQERLEALVQRNIITAQEAGHYIAQNERLLKTVVLPAYAALGDGLLLLEEHDAVPAGLAALPEGKAYYEQLVISQTGSYRTMDEIRGTSGREIFRGI